MTIRAEHGTEPDLSKLMGASQRAEAAIRGLATDVQRIGADIETLRTRIATYVGEGVALTRLVDDTPIFVNANDFGGPTLFMLHGRYEEDNLAVLQSFTRPDTTFLDIGANLGFFAMQIARRLRSGKVYAFEPHPFLAELCRRNQHINGFDKIVDVKAAGLSDEAGVATFKFPKGHLGGGSVHLPDQDHAAVTAPVHRLDDIMPDDFRTDLVKIDVEGHEFAVLRGMRRVIERSPCIKILFEHLWRTGDEAECEALLAEMGFDLFRIMPGAHLEPLRAGALGAWSGYVLAAKSGQVESADRRRFTIYPAQVSIVAESAAEHQVLFHGPYWFLPRGLWRVNIHGEIAGDITLTIAERYGHAAATVVPDASGAGMFVAERDLLHFETVARARGGKASIRLERIELARAD